MWLVNILLHSAFVFQIQNLELLIFCIDGEKFVVNLGYVPICRFCYIIKVNISYVLDLWSFYMYIYIYYILLWSFELIAILFISSIKTMCFSLLYLCCAFEITLLFFMNSLSCFWRLYISISVRNGIFYFKLSCF